MTATAPRTPSGRRPGWPRWRAPSTWTLRTKLVTSMVALFTLMSLVTGIITLASLDRFLTGQIDQSLSEALSRAIVPDYDNDGRGPGNGGPRGPGAEGLVLRLRNGVAIDNTVRDDNNEAGSLTDDQISTLTAASLSRPTTIDLGGSVGSYRVMAARTRSGDTLVVGLPTGPNQETLTALLVVVVAGAGIALLGVAVGGTWLVRRNLRPLRRVADTASRVAELPLSTGQVALGELRVPAADTDTRTEVGQVGHALNELLDHVDTALNDRHRSEQRVRQFVADASHELRTPLASIRGYAELSRREPEPVPAAVAHALGRVESEAARMGRLVDDLLLLARLDTGRPLDREPVDLTQLLINAVSDAHAASPDHVWTLDLPDEPVEAIGDPARLHQVVANLLANARTHTPAGTTVLTALRNGDGRVRLTVSDDGPGVPPDLIGNVFERFARGDTARTRAAGSTGLGLSIVAAVTAAHGGQVQVSSVPGQTTFAVTLPIA